ncbi:hypothetical protein [Actinocatenispora rupis]|uniref:Uncharacterized protein n=1 Tax=Actinocatenispora rupis TaxID=519421 RepID=A0A8J3JHJ1_9ACTN|nr:hypothetical protein [Actinocatenispora rupis]GID15048.1 hypothetical protein Aru02nite_59370 [Actinocatenispora rupis]
MRRVLAFVTSRYGLAGLAALAVIMVVLVGRVFGLGGSGDDGGSGTVSGGQASADAGESGAPNDGPTGAPSKPDPVVKPGQAGPLVVATSFGRAYVKSDVPAKQWRAALTKYATPKLATTIRTIDPMTVPADALTGVASLGDHGAVWADVDLPTDAGMLTFRLTSDGTVWRVDGIDWTPKS